MDNDDVIDTLNDLIETCKDGAYGFRASAEHVKSPELRATFTDRARECDEGAAQLQTLVAQYGGKPDTGGSASGAMHRGWVAARGALSGYTDLAMLEECERGEDAAVARYRKALESDLPPEVRSVVERQFQGVKRNHDQVRDLRNRMKATQ
jgi:uncharacterized protein (TIGR02284 family)